jgi:6-phosphogluconolactonase (cycloisomerase 2 family)
MARVCWLRTALPLLAALACSAPPAGANQHNGCADVNNTSNNRITVYETVGTTGELKWVEEVVTGGIGSRGGFYSIPQIVSTPPRDGTACVFAVNAATHDVSAFKVVIEHEGQDCDCKHHPAAAGPVTIGSDAQFGPLGGGVALLEASTLYTANPGSSNISTFTISPDCGLALTGSRVPTPGPPADIQVKPDGKCLAVSSPDTDRIAMYSIGSDHLLTPAGEVSVPGSGRASGIEFSETRLSRDSLYVAKADPDEIVIVRFSVLPGCKLAANPTVTKTAKGRAGSVLKLDPDNRCLFVPNQRSDSVTLLSASRPSSRITTFSVEPLTGELSLVGTFDDVAFLPSGLAFGETTAGDRFLYYTSFPREVFRRPVVGCVPGPVIEPSVSTDVPGAGLLRGLTIIQ